MAKELTEKQRKFLDVLFDEANGDVTQAKLLAGYAPTSSTSDIVRGIKEEVLEATQMFMARNAPRAAVAMVSGINDPTELGMREKMTAAKELLDRTGLVKTEKMQVEASGGVMLMPPKAVSEDDWKYRQVETTTTNRYKRTERMDTDTAHSTYCTIWI